jgi:hypothetical protein
MGFSGVLPVTISEHRRALLAAIAGNAIPLIGVGVLGWNLSALVVLYWLELALIFFFAVIRGLFAGRRSELDAAGLIVGALSDRRASLSVPRTHIAIHLSSMPVVLIAIPLLTALWLVVGAVTVGVVGADRLGDATYEMIALAFLAMLFKEAGQTAVKYLHRGGYKHHSAQTAIRGPFIRGGLLFVGGLFTVTAAAAGSDTVASDVPISELDPALIGTPVLIGIVLVKFGFDLAGVFRDQLTAFDESTTISFGWAYEPPTVEPVDAALTEPTRSIRPDWRGRLFGGVTNIGRHSGVLKLGGSIWLVAALFATGQVWHIVALLAVAGIVVPLLLVSVDYWLRFGAVEYRTDGDAIVAYDRLFGHALWRIEPWDEIDLRVERDRLDTFLNTDSILVTLRDNSIIQIPCVPDPEPLLDVFDRQPDGVSPAGEEL